MTFPCCVTLTLQCIIICCGLNVIVFGLILIFLQSMESYDNKHKTKEKKTKNKFK